MTEGPVSYEYITTVDVHRICVDVFGDNNRVTRWLDDIGSEPGGSQVSCSLVVGAGATAGFVGGPKGVITGGTIGGIVCAASVIGCTAENIFSEMTTCNGVEVEVYGRAKSTVITSSPPVLLVPKCDEYLDPNDVTDTLQKHATGTVDTAVDYGSNAANSVEDHGNNVVGTADDIASELADEGGDLLSEGADLIRF